MAWKRSPISPGRVSFLDCCRSAYRAGSSAAPYVAGTLLAVRKVGGWTGVRRGLDTLLD